MKNLFFLVLYLYYTFATDLYVYKTGISNLNCTSSSPCLSIKDALSVAQSGDTIYVGPGSYVFEGLSGVVFALTSKHIALKSLGGPEVTSITSGGLSCAGLVGAPMNLTIEGFGIRNYSVAPTLSNIISILGYCNLNISNSVFVNNICFQSITSPSTSGLILTADSTTSVTMNNVVFKNNNLNGRYCVVSRGFSIIRNIRIENNNAWGIRQDASTIRLYDSFFMKNTFAAVTMRNAAFAEIYRNNFHSPPTLTTGVVHCGDSGISILGQANNSFCGSQLVQNCIWPVEMLEIADNCGICSGDNSKMDCQGVCWGNNNTNCPVKTKWFVAPNGTGNGTSKASPLGTIQSAINAASDGQEVVLLPGNYTGPGNVNLLFSGKKIKLTSINQAYTDAIIDCQAQVGVWSFKINSTETAETWIDSITITKCYYPIEVYNNATIRITNTKFFQNQFYSSDIFSAGGAINVKGGGAIIENSEFHTNSAINGGAIVVLNDGTSASGIVVKKSRFLNNKAGTNLNFIATAIFFQTMTSGKIFNSNFIGNTYLISPGFVSKSGQITAEQDVQLVFVNNSFYFDFVNERVYTFLCSTQQNGRFPWEESNTSYCGPNTNLDNGSFCIYVNSTIVLTASDTCKICAGNVNYNGAQDCAGQCWGCNTLDPYGGCCRVVNRDCGNRCPASNGSLFNSYDIHQTCCSADSIRCSECNGKCCDPPCANGYCTSDYPATCNCSQGYFGSTCNQFTCSRACVNGYCSAPDTCNCSSGYTGATCEQPICSPSCLNGGTCVSPNNCSCVYPYSGPDCSFCGDKVCLNNGACFLNTTTVEYLNTTVVDETLNITVVEYLNFTIPECSCVNGYYGENCSLFDCTNPCLNGGRCVGPETCDCSGTGYTGAVCDVPVIGGVVGDSSESFSNSGNSKVRMVGIIFGVVFGVVGVALIVLVVFFIVFYISKKNRKQGLQLQAFQLQMTNPNDVDSVGSYTPQNSYGRN